MSYQSEFSGNPSLLKKESQLPDFIEKQEQMRNVFPNDDCAALRAEISRLNDEVARLQNKIDNDRWRTS